MRHAVGALAVVVLCAVDARAAYANEPRVTVIGDSVLMAVQSNAEPMRIMQDGLDIHMEIGVCRRLTGESCPFEGTRVPTLVDRVRQLAAGGELTPDVVVEVGYNDPADTFPAAVEEALEVLHDAGAERVWWATLRESQDQYPGMNQVLRDAAARHPELTLIDWNAYADGRTMWFQTDGEHLLYDGALGFATLIHASVLGLPVVFPDPTAPARVLSLQPLAVARARRAYRAQLVVSGGVAPYRWRIVGGRPPRGVHLLAGGVVYGIPQSAGATPLVLEVQDAAGDVASFPATLVVRPR